MRGKEWMQLRALIRPAMLALVAAGMLSGTASAQYSGGLTASDTTVKPGQPITVSGDGYAGGAQVTITLESHPVTLKTTTANSSGAFSESVTIPNDMEPGQHTIFARGAGASGGTRELSIPITVTGEGGRGGGGVGGGLATGGAAEAAEPVEGGDLAFTGRDITLMVVVAGGLLALGSGLLRLGRRAAQRNQTSE